MGGSIAALAVATSVRMIDPGLHWLLSHHVSVNAPSQERLGSLLLGSYDGPPGVI